MERRPAEGFSIFWWAGYAVLAIWTQKYVPGVDFLAPGLALSLQERSGIFTIILALIWVLLQEGMGNMAFGYAVAFYGLLTLAYLGGRWLFEARSFAFMCLLGGGLGVAHYVLVYSLSGLQGIEWPVGRTIWESVLQAAVFPIVWLIAEHFFPNRMKRDVAPL